MKTKEHPLESLTRGEEEIMQYLWQLEKGSVNDLLSVIQEPKPKYTTVATFIKILERKGYVGYDVKGKSYEYYPAHFKRGVCPYNCIIGFRVLF